MFIFFGAFSGIVSDSFEAGGFVHDKSGLVYWELDLEKGYIFFLIKSLHIDGKNFFLLNAHKIICIHELSNRISIIVLSI